MTDIIPPVRYSERDREEAQRDAACEYYGRHIAPCCSDAHDEIATTCERFVALVATAEEAERLTMLAHRDRIGEYVQVTAHATPHGYLILGPEPY